MEKLVSARFVSSTLVSVLFLIAVNLAEPNPASAQDLDNVTVTGRVADQNGAIIPGATIEAILLKTGATRTTVADDEGRYRIIQLEPGIYNLSASFAGFATEKKQELIFIAGKN